MKPLLIRYIGLLIICGLMLPFYRYTIGTTGKMVKKVSNLITTPPVKHRLTGKIHENSFSFFRDVVTNILPVLKNLN
jgi:hypothetical protein